MKVYLPLLDLSDNARSSSNPTVPENYFDNVFTPDNAVDRYYASVAQDLYFLWLTVSVKQPASLQGRLTPLLGQGRIGCAALTQILSWHSFPS